MIVHDELKLPNIEEGKRVKSYILKVTLKYLSIDTLEQAEGGVCLHCCGLRIYLMGKMPKQRTPEIKGMKLLKLLRY